MCIGDHLQRHIYIQIKYKVRLLRRYNILRRVVLWTFENDNAGASSHVKTQHGAG